MGKQYQMEVRDRQVTARPGSYYQGAKEYTIDGNQYVLRDSACAHHAWNGDYYERGVLPAVGTIICMSDMQHFPLAEIVALFPGYVGARWEIPCGANDGHLVYDGPPPAKVWDKSISSWVAVAGHPELAPEREENARRMRELRERMARQGVRL